MRRAQLSHGTKGLLGLVIVAVVSTAVYVGVRWAYGAFDDNYQLVADFPRAGQGLERGSDVTYRGVDVGEVRSIELVDRQARVTMDIDPDFRMPADAQVVVRPKTVFGEKFVDVSFPDGDGGPYLHDGQTIEDARSATEVEDFFEGSNDLFEAVDQNELGQLVTELSSAARGTGEDVAAAWGSGAEATGVGADTLEPQLRALRSWADFQEAIRGIGGDLNAISANNNVALAEFNSHRAAYERVLATLRPFAEDLADLLVATRPDLDTYLARGDSVARLLIANRDRITEVIEGLGDYTRAFGNGLSAERLPDGEGFAYFKNFLYLDDVQHFICSHLAEAPDEFAGLRDAMLEAVGAFDCSGYYAASSSGPPPEVAGALDQAQAAQRLVNQIYGLIGTPQTDVSQDLEAMLHELVGEDQR